MGKRIMLIVNPKAGKEQYRHEIAGILDVLCKKGSTVGVYMTAHRGHAEELVRKEGSLYDAVACVGGDGTLGETISGLMRLKIRPPVCHIPLGTANDVAASLDLPRNPSEAARLLRTGTPTPIDVGRFAGKHFTYIAAFGAFTEVSYQTPHENKKNLGHLAYLLEGMGRLSKVTPHNLVVEFDGKNRMEGEFIFGAVANTTSIAGLVKIKRDLVNLSDGAFEVILVKNPRNIVDINNIFMGVFTQKYDEEYVQVRKAKKVRFLFENPVPWTRDGEDGGFHTDITLRAIQPGVQIFLPKGRSHRPKGGGTALVLDREE